MEAADRKVNPEEEMSAAAREGDWPRYFAALGLKTEAERAVDVPQPAPEVTSLDPWPDGFVVPGGAVRLLRAVEAAGWEGRKGYSRASRAGVHKNEWVTVHYVGVWAQRGSQRVYARWYAKAGEPGAKLVWSWDGGSVNGWHAAKVGDVIAALFVV